MLTTHSHSIAKVHNHANGKPYTKSDISIGAELRYEKHIGKYGDHLKKWRERKFVSGYFCVLGLYEQNDCDKNDNAQNNSHGYYY